MCVFVRTCVCVCVCLSVSIFSIKHFSGTAARRILKFGTNVGYGSLYCGKEDGPVPACSSIYSSTFHSNQNFSKRISQLV